MPSVQFRLIGNKEVRDDLRARRARGESLRPLLTDWADFVLKVEQQQFRTGKGWRRLKASTRRWKERRGLDPRILVATGRLEKSLTSRAHPQHIRIIDRDGAFAGTRVFYARFHKKSRPPARIRPDDRRQTVAMTRAYLTRREGAPTVRWL